MHRGLRVLSNVRQRIPRIIVDVNDRVFAVIVPAPEELLQAGLNSAFLTALEEAQTGLDYVAINAVKSTLGDRVPLSCKKMVFV